MRSMSDFSAVVAAGEQRLLQRLRELVEVESPSDDKAAVDHAVDCILPWIAELGGSVKRHRQKLHGDVLEARFGGRSRKRGRVMILGHLDTVWPLGTLAKMPWREAGGKLYGPGVLDMKAGVIMALEAVSALRELNELRPITLLLNSDEEIGSPISRPITERVARECSAAFVLEPAQGLAYKTARKGIGNYTLHVQGVASHSGVDFEKGHSAVLEMARLVEKVSAFTDLSKGRTVNVGVIRGGTQSNVIAAECTASVDVRIVKAADGVAVDKLFRALKVTDKACKLTVVGGINRPPMERKPGTVALYKQARTLAAEMGFVLEEAATGGGSDGNFTAAIGVPTLDGMGPVGAGAHAAQEHIVLTHLLERTTLLTGLLAAVD